MKITLRIAAFVLGALLIFFGWRKGRTETMTMQNNPTTSSTTYSPEIISVGGGFLILAAFAPSPGTLGRWMSLKRRKPAPQPHYRRRKG